MTTKQMLNRQIESEMIKLEQHLDQSFDKINNFIDQVFTLDSSISNFSNTKLELSLPKVDKFNLIGQSEFESNIIQEVKALINLKIKDQLQLQSDSKSLIQSQQQSQLIQQIQQNQTQSPSSQFNLKPFTYQIIQANSIKQNEYCYAIAINKDCSIVAVGCENGQIKIYEFKQGLMKQIQVLNEHQSSVDTLIFMKKSNQFISGDDNGSIVIWSNNNNIQWNSSQTIQGHSHQIQCLILNNNEDLFISSSYDKTIKFWIISNQWICQQTITDHTSSVNQICLNDQQNKVISCGCDKQILVIEYSQQNKKWIVKQNITVDSVGFRLCFINNNLFTFQQMKGNLMHVYEMNSVSQQFTKTKDITVNQGNDGWYYFPQQYIKQKQILVNKHHEYVNFIRKTQKDEFIVEQSIHFNTYTLFGQLSDDGEYLITWDNSSEEIQIRKYQEQ